jgi:acyl-CoA hydrolase
MIEMVLPQYANLLGNILGGRVNENGNPCPVPPVILRTQAERRRYREAGERRKARLAIRAKRRRPGDR